jgi:ABC-type Na+ efflux pump permease subunit
MGSLSFIATIARWEVKRSSGSLGRRVLPVALVLVVFMVAATGFATQQGLHLQDNLFRAGTSDGEVASFLAADERFTVMEGDFTTVDRDSLDIIIAGNRVYARDSDRGRAALLAIERNYDQYRNFIYRQEPDLFAAYPLWIDLQTVKSELDFSATDASSRITARPNPGSSAAPFPEQPFDVIPTPLPGLGLTAEEVRAGFTDAEEISGPVARYTEVLGGESPFGSFRTPSQLSPPLPFDSMIPLFLFIFPLYFASQFYMMSIMQERIGRTGEPLLSSPAGPAAIIVGKAVPYLLGILGVSTAVILYLDAPLLVLLPLIPVVLFFFASALIIGMISRSFRDLSFISLFFATLVTSYLLFPSIFASVHVISIISPLTLIVFTLQNEPYTVAQYLYSTSLFFLTSAVLFAVGVMNFREERLFSQAGLLKRFREFVSAALPEEHPLAALFTLNALAVPFVFMAQMMLLVLFFNLPLPLSLILLLVSAALIEELVKSVGISTLILDSRDRYPWKRVLIGSLVTAAAFLVAEKLLLFVTLAQISESVFGSILFLSLSALALPFLLHFTGTLITASFVRWKGSAGYVPGLLLATGVHCLYNAVIIMGVLR